MTVHIEVRNGESFAVMPLIEFERIQSDALMFSDIHAFDMAKQNLANGSDEVIPFSIIQRRLAGESPLKIWREYRHLTQETLAQKAEASRSLIAAIEAGHKQGGVASLLRLAQVLHVSVEQLISASLKKPVAQNKS